MIKFIFSDLFERATATAKTTASGFSASNVQDAKPRNVWRSQNVADQWLKFDLGSATAIDSFVIVNNNLSSSASVKLYGHASDLGNNLSDWQSSALFKTNNTLTFDDVVGGLFLSSSETYQWWLLELDDASNSEGFLEVGKVFGGISKSPNNNFNENFTQRDIDVSRSFRVEGMHKYSVSKPIIRGFDITFNDVPTSDKNNFLNWFAEVGKTQPFIVSLDSSNDLVETTRYVTNESDLDIIGQPNTRFTLGMNLLEVK